MATNTGENDKNYQPKETITWTAEMNDTRSEFQKSIGDNFEENPTYKMINALYKKAEEQEAKFRIQADRLKIIRGKTKKLSNRIEDSKLKIIETLGIFVALFTFISIDFQAFKNYQDPKSIAGLTLILLGSLLIFVTILDFLLNIQLPIIKDKKGEEETKLEIFKIKTWAPGFTIRVILMIIWTILIIFGVLLFTKII